MAMTREDYLNIRDYLNKQQASIKQEIEALNAGYIKTFPFKAGDKVRGTNWQGETIEAYVVQVQIADGHPYYILAATKKDGTISKLREWRIEQRKPIELVERPAPANTP